MKRILAWGPDLRDMARFAAPIVLVNVGIQAMGVVDALMVGKLGGAAIASVALGNLYFFNISVLGLGLLLALDPVIAQAVGAGDTDDVARSVQRGLVIAAILTVVVTLALMPGESLLRAFNQPADVIPGTAIYTRRRALGVLPFFVFNVMRQTLQAMASVRAVVIAVLVANVVNVGANWLLVFGNLGAPRLGVTGSGYATAARCG